MGAAMIFWAAVLSGCADFHEARVSDSTFSNTSNIREVPYSRAQVYQKLMDQFKSWQGTAYRLGGSSKRGIDCSGFVQVTYYEKIGIHLPRTTHELSETGIGISRSGVAIGDLILFKTGFFSRHVGIYIGNGRFIHASKSDGVILSRLDDEYWSDRFWTARRVIDPAKPETD